MIRFIALLYAAGCFICYGCGGSNAALSAEDQLRAAAMADSFRIEAEKRAINDVYGDTIGLSSSPIRVTSARIIDSEGGNYRNVSLAWVNTSKMNISAVRFMWKGVNAFNEPADMGNSFTRGYGGGFSDAGLRPGKKSSGTWEILSRDAKKILYAWPVEVVYSDGSKWKLKPE